MILLLCKRLPSQANALWENNVVFCLAYPSLAAASFIFNGLMVAKSSSDYNPTDLLPKLPSLRQPTSSLYFLQALLMISVAFILTFPSILDIPKLDEAHLLPKISETTLLLIHTSAPGFILSAASSFVLQVSAVYLGCLSIDSCWMWYKNELIGSKWTK